jgi:uncharacterized membrane protein YccC
MVTVAPSTDGNALEAVLDFLDRELRPYPGRTAAVARIVLACVITMLIVVVTRLPFGFLAVLFVVAMPRGDSSSTIQHGIRMLLANAAGAAMAMAALTVCADYPLPYFLSVVGRLFLVFFLTRTLVKPATAFGFSIILVAAIVVWDRPGFTVEGQVETTLWTAIGMTMATLVTMATEWSLAPAMHAPTGPAGAAKAGHIGRLFVDDAFSNPEHVSFALKGCLAATICYLLYSAVAWPGMAVCTVTCVLAAPVAPVGSAAQRVLTRLAGLLIGGIVLGIGSQVFVLPFADSIVGFGVPFAAACGVIAWCATASPRFSYISRPMAMGYLLTLFQTYGLNPSLALTRDRLMGVLLGIVLMWLVFDSRWITPGRRLAPQPAR